MPDKSKLLRAAADFRHDITPAKQAVDTVLVHLGRLISSTSANSIDVGVASIVAHSTLVEIGTAITSTIAVRDRLIRVHQAAKTVGREQLPELAWGDNGDTKPEPLFVEHGSSLRAVTG